MSFKVLCATLVIIIAFVIYSISIADAQFDAADTSQTTIDIGLSGTTDENSLSIGLTTPVDIINGYVSGNYVKVADSIDVDVYTEAGAEYKGVHLKGFAEVEHNALDFYNGDIRPGWYARPGSYEKGPFVLSGGIGTFLQIDPNDPDSETFTATNFLNPVMFILARYHAGDFEVNTIFKYLGNFNSNEFSLERHRLKIDPTIMMEGIWDTQVGLQFSLESDTDEDDSVVNVSLTSYTLLIRKVF